MNLSLQNASNVPLIVLLSRENTYVTETLLNLSAPGLWPGICCVLVKKNKLHMHLTIMYYVYIEWNTV